MENTMTEILTFATVIAVFVSAVMEMIKRTTSGKLTKRWIPAISFVVGLIIGALAYPFTEMDLVLRLWSGGISGFMASGIYEAVKQTKKI